MARMVTQCLLWWQEVRLIISTPARQGSVEDPVGLLSKIGTGEVDTRKFRVLSEDLVGQSETLSNSDGEFGLQLENDLLFCHQEYSDQALRLGFLAFLSNSSEANVESFGYCDLGLEDRGRCSSCRCWCLGTLEFDDRVLNVSMRKSCWDRCCA